VKSRPAVVKRDLTGSDVNDPVRLRSKTRIPPSFAWVRRGYYHQRLTPILRSKLHAKCPRESGYSCGTPQAVLDILGTTQAISRAGRILPSGYRLHRYRFGTSHSDCDPRRPTSWYFIPKKKIPRITRSWLCSPLLCGLASPHLQIHWWRCRVSESCDAWKSFVMYLFECFPMDQSDLSCLHLSVSQSLGDLFPRGGRVCRVFGFGWQSPFQSGGLVANLLLFPFQPTRFTGILSPPGCGGRGNDRIDDSRFCASSLLLRWSSVVQSVA